MTPADRTVPLSLWQRLRRVAPWFAGHTGTYALALAGVLVGSATEPAIPALMKPLLDNGFQQGGLVLWHIPVVLLLLFGVRGLAGFVAAYCLARVANASMARLRQHLFEKMLRVDPRLFQHQQASSLTNSMVYEVNNGASVLVNTVLSLAKDLFTLIALLGYLMVLNWKLTLIVFAVFPPIAWVVKTLTRRLQKVIRDGQEATETLAYVVEENVLAHRMVRLHNAQRHQADKFQKVNERLRQLAIKSVVANSLMTPLIQLLAALALSAVITVAIWQSSHATQAVTVGGFAAFITAMLMLISPIKHLSEVLGSLTRGVTAIERGLEMLDALPDESQGSHAADTVRGEVEFKNVSLTYPSATTPALNQVNLHIRAGQTVALVGASGSGKTTLANLLPRFLSPSSGEVLLDGVPVSEWQLANLRAHMAYVSQDVVMFNDSIANNIALGDVVDSKRLWEALRAANLAQWVQGLPQQENTWVGHNATELSGGQRQRLAIARALYKNAAVLILDEATSALDNASEQLVKDALQLLMQERTSIVIAHRLSTIEHADVIVVMQDGAIAEMGSHHALMAQGGVYARLHASALLQPSTQIKD